MVNKNYNEYGVMKGGKIANEIDIAAHRMAKIIAKNNGFDLDKYAVVTKSLQVNYKLPIKSLTKKNLRVFNRGFYKGKDIHISVTVHKTKQDVYITVAEAKLVFTCKKRSEFEQTII